MALTAVIQYKNGLNTDDLYDYLMNGTRKDQRILVAVNTRHGKRTYDVTDVNDFNQFDAEYRRGQYMSRVFLREDCWNELAMARVYNGARVVRELFVGQIIPKLARGQEVWAKTSDGVLRMVAHYDPAIVGEFQSSAEPVEQIAVAVEE